MKRWRENILTPINKLFTHNKKRRAHSQRTTMPMVPLVPSWHNAMETGSSSRPEGSSQAPCTPVHALAQAHFTWTWLKILQTLYLGRHCRAPLNLRGPLAPLPSSITGSTARLLGEVLSMPAGPLPMSYAQKTWLPPGPTPMSRVRRRSGHSADTPGLRGTESNPPCSHRRQLPLSYHPHLKTFCLGVDPSRDLGHKFLQLRRGLSVFSTSKQDQRGHTTLMLKTGCWLWRGGVRFSPSGCRVDNSGRLGPPQCGSALLAHLGSLEVMASLHCLDV